MGRRNAASEVRLPATRMIATTHAIRARHAPAVSSWAVGAAFTARDAAPAQRTQSRRFGRRLRYAVLQGPGRRDVFSDRVEQNDLPRQDPEYVDLLRRVLAIQADCEIG